MAIHTVIQEQRRKDGLEECEIDLWEMYRDYIDGKKEVAEINAEFQTDYFAG